MTPHFKHFVTTLVCSFIVFVSNAQSNINVLVFSKTVGFRHESIAAGITAITKMGKDKSFTPTFTEDASAFTASNLAKYNAVVFLNTTGDVLNDEQQYAFERYIQAGGGYVGIHSATDCEYEWPWYGGLAGAYFLDHPMTPSNVQKGRFEVVLKNHWATKGMPDAFDRTDEFYSFKNISSKINVILKIDEKSYIGGKNPDFHPMSWYQEYDGGRSFYTAMGHTNETFEEPLFLDHLWAGIKYASGGEAPKVLDFSKSKPEENRFSKVVLKEKLDEPMELCILDNDRILLIERKGAVKLYSNKTKTLKTIAKIPVSTKYVNKEGKESEAEDGLLGLNKDPNFATNHWIYLYYSTTEGSKNILARYTMKGDQLLLSSKKTMLEVPTQREECCHTGGSIAWDKDGNLYLSTGDNTNPHGSDGYSPSDETTGRSAWDAQKSSANTNDLRGKIIRIKPQADGTYTIPEGNLFPKGTPLTKPEIYTMGHRNPFRISVDQNTNYVYWGEVGPDASKPDSLRGPEGHDEVGQAKKAGNFGWPHFVGNNKAYYKYDFENKKSLFKWDENAPKNTSPNNTGLKDLPPAQNALIWYPYATSKEFPLLGSGGRNAMAGPVFYKDNFKNATRSFPSYYDKKLFMYEWMRGFIMSVTLDENGNYKSMERFMPSYKFSNPMDMEFAANGDLYMLEYGTGWFTQNDDARLIRIEYNGGNRPPSIVLNDDQLGGKAPYKLNINADGSTDADGDVITYTWKITSKNGYKKTVVGPALSLTLNRVGMYKATLEANDGKGGISRQTKEIIVGNERPVVKINMPKSNKSFYVSNKPFAYNVSVSDKEDGRLGKGISAANVALSIDYLAEGFDKVAVAQGHRSADALTKVAKVAKGKILIDKSDCNACHKKASKSIGPSYMDMSKKYKQTNATVEKLVSKVINGGGGVWGDKVMSAHPQLKKADAEEMIKYILNVSKEKPKEKTLPLNGTYTAKLPSNDKGKGVYILRASYEDRGSKGIRPLKAEETLVLKNATVDVHGFDEYTDVNKMSFEGRNLAIPAKSGSFMKMNNVDLNNVLAIEVAALAPKPQANAVGGKIEVRIGAANGKLIGQSKFLEATDSLSFTPNFLTIDLNSNDIDHSKSHDVYLVYVNDKSKDQTLMVVVGVEFKFDKSSTKAVVTDFAPKKEMPSSTDYFVGSWNTTFFGTPQGDVDLILSLSRKDGKLTGSITPKADLSKIANLDKIEEQGNDITFYFQMAGFNLNVKLSKDDDNTMIGTMMGMFKTKAVRGM